MAPIKVFVKNVYFMTHVLNCLSLAVKYNYFLYDLNVINLIIFLFVSALFAVLTYLLQLDSYYFIEMISY